MRTKSFVPLLTSLCLAFLLSCGSSPPYLVSITVAPSAASAQDSSQGTVQFSASGQYSDGHIDNPLKALWFVQQPPWIKAPIPGGVSVNSDTGLAQCTTYSGAIAILAIAPKYEPEPLSDIYHRGPSGQFDAVSGKAQLTCIPASTGSPSP